jgi:Asp-tRNA(Asn)/Glu-tRNA(Gln) amidotransferase C subunit
MRAAALAVYTAGELGHHPGMAAPHRDLDTQTITTLTRAARLELSSERVAALAPLATDVYALIDSLDAISPGEVPPATAFDARRR